MTNLFSKIFDFFTHLKVITEIETVTKLSLILYLHISYKFFENFKFSTKLIYSHIQYLNIALIG